ncbi:site-specific integrase [Nocardioides ochotonae]|uniref:site-specific integrase n=1 Tax=Nocardioides ochotonae TaxID=2685869 RepID=UPI001408170D|nr:site-specific integrase [Nocardioides ochotonae]
MRTGRPPLTVGTWGDITTTRMPNGTWRARGRYRDHDGTVSQVARFRPTKTEAVSALKLAFIDREDPTAATVTAHLRVNALVEVYLADIALRPSLAPSSRERYAKTAVTLLAPGLGELQIRELTVPAINRFLAAVARKHGYAAAKMARSVLSGMVQLAIDHGALRDNPVRQARRLEAPRRQAPRALSVAEHAELLDRVAADRKARELDLVDLIEFLSATGARIGEASAVRTPHLDLVAGVVEITATATDAGIQEWTKTDAGWRVLALPPHVVATLQRRLADPAIRTDVVLFPSPLGRVRNRSNTTAELRRLFDRLGFDWVTSHTFRKTVATRLDEAGISARQVADQLGHRNPSMTTDVYMGRKTTVAAAASILVRPTGPAG